MQAIQKNKNSKKSRQVPKSAPAAKSFKSSSHNPSFSTTKDGSIRITRTEFVTTLGDYAANIFQFDPNSIAIPGYDLNPGCSLLFPWLSQIANCYERFRFDSVSFRLVSANPTSMSGRVYMALDYDYDDAVPTDKLGLMSNRSAVSGPVWDELRLRADPKQLHPDDSFKYVSSNSRLNFVEPRTSYCGFLLLAVSGLPPTGETSLTSANFDLEVTYSVILTTPVLEGTTIVDTLTGQNYIPVSAMTFSSGPNGQYYSNMADLTMPDVTRGSQVKRVRAGTDGIPALKNRGTGSTFEYAYDISHMPRHKGVFASILQTFASSISPADLVGVKGAQGELQCFDDEGAYLGVTCQYSSSQDRDPSAFEAVDAGPGVIATTNGSILTTIIKTGMAALFAKFPLCKYLIPAAMFSTTLGSGNMRTGLQIEL